MPHKHCSLPRTTYQLTLLASLIAALFCPLAHAAPALGASFEIVDGQTVTTQQTLDDNQTGVIQVGGTLKTTADNTPAINATGDNVNITNNGLISTSGGGVSVGTNSAGIYSTGTNATLINSGTISTTGNYAYGIYSQGTDATLINSGTITTAGDESKGIRSDGNNASLTNSGTITTARENGFGISSIGTNATIDNSGTITTTGLGGVGIYSQGDNVTVTNSGTISTIGDVARGIRSDNVNAILTNSGTISTTGDDSDGIRSDGNNATLTNSGTITTTGSSAHGIYSTGSDATVNHSGSITVTGADATGINSDVSSGNSATLNVSGSVVATGSATQAIVGGAGDETLNLYSGASIIGTIDLGGGTNAVNVFSNGAGPSATMTITNPGTVTHNSGNALTLVDGSTVRFVDTTNLTADQASLGFVSSGIFGAINQQLDQTAALPRPVKVASTRLASGMLPHDTSPVGWGHVFGKQAKQGSNGAALSFKDNTFGMVGGYEQTLGAHRAGFFGGVSHSNVDTETASIRNESDSVFVGVYGQYASGDWRLNGALATGYVSYDNQRLVTDNVNGYETATADYHGVYISPSVSLMRIVDRGAGFSWRPSVSLNYTYGRLSHYDETGTTRSNLSVGSRNASVLNSRLQLAARQVLVDGKGEYAFRGGLSHSNYGSDNVKIHLQGGATTNYGITGTGSVTGPYVGANGRMQWKKNLNLVGDVEYANTNGGGYTMAAYAGMEYLF